jgi:AbrB family transcriptional regulator (stage V sporulation protein T)
MKESGIVRKLDNLGRLVIPKEIRRCMRIKEGSPIEFGILPSGEIVLTKYSLVGQISDYADEFCQILGEIFDCIVMVGDRDKIVSSYGISKKNTTGNKLSIEVLDIMDSKSSYTACKKENTTILPLLEDDVNTYFCQMIYPIVIQGDVEGVVILSDIKENRCFGVEHMTTLRLVTKFISRQME